MDSVQGGLATGRDDAPTGVVTFLFTDVQGSTSLWETAPDQMADALAEHDRRMREEIERRRGYVFTTAGDSFSIAFSSAVDAVAAAVAIQRRLAEPCGELLLLVRMGLNTGVATVREGDYFGGTVNRSARISAAGHGGQILVAGPTAELVRPSLDAETELIDLGDHRLKDLPQPERIFQLRRPDLTPSFPALRTLEGPWSNLPNLLTSFVGRDRELIEVYDLLRSNRLVTLTGPGGAGKTRLALQLAADSLEDHPDGVRLVELAAVTDKHVVADEVAQRVGAQPIPGESVVGTIAAKVGDARMLLVLDNCEHLVGSVAELAGTLLRSCDRLRILATSRERLAIDGEVTYRVPSLGLPDASSLEQARESDSMRLLVERAEVARPGFDITPDNVAPAAAICHRLDGIPLALELAASQLRVLSAEQVASRLAKRLPLGDGGRSVADRHRTLQKTIDWSHDLLDEPERAVFRRVSVFAGNFDLDAAEAVCGAAPVGGAEVLGLLTALIDRSMLVPEEELGSDTRYRVLETMREYGGARMSEADESVETATRHAEHYASVGESLQRLRRSGDLGGALAGLERDEDNVRAALRFCIDHGQLEVAARIVGAVGYLWYASGAFREGVAWCEELFDRDPDLSDVLLAPALHAYGTLLGSWAQPAAGAEILRREVELRRGLGDRGRLAAALNNLGNLLNDAGRTDEAEAMLREAIVEFRAAKETATLALSSLAYGYLHAGEFDRAVAAYEEALADAVAHEERYGIALATAYLGQCAANQGRTDVARSQLEEARASFVALGVTPGVAYVEILLGLVDRDCGDNAAAARHLLIALEHPDAHWYMAAKFWILQFAAGLVEDAPLAASLVGVAGQFYAAVEETQPAFVLDDLDAIQTRLRAALGDQAFDAATGAGQRMEHNGAIASAVRELELIGAVETQR